MVAEDLAAPVIECPACHGVRHKGPLERYREWTLYECTACRVQHFWPAKNPGADWYQASEMYQARDLMVVDWLAWYHRAGLEHLPVSTGRLLDVGCGNGVFVAAAERRGFEATGIDFSEKAIEAGRRRFGLQRLYCMSVEELAVRTPEPFDVVTAFEVLEHMDDSDRFLSALVGVLAPGGHLVISVPNRARRPWLLNEGDVPPHHFTRWDADALRHHMLRHDLEPLETIVCPPRVTIKAYLMFKIHFDIVVRLLRRSESRSIGPGDSGAPLRTNARRLMLLKDRVLGAVAAVAAPPLSPFVRGPMIVSIAQRKR